MTTYGCVLSGTGPRPHGLLCLHVPWRDTMQHHYFWLASPRHPAPILVPVAARAVGRGGGGQPQTRYESTMRLNPATRPTGPLDRPSQRERPCSLEPRLLREVREEILVAVPSAVSWRATRQNGRVGRLSWPRLGSTFVAFFRLCERRQVVTRASIRGSGPRCGGLPTVPTRTASAHNRTPAYRFIQNSPWLTKRTTWKGAGDRRS